MTERVRYLWKQGIDTVPYIDPERAMLITEFYKSDAAKGLSEPILRAYAFKHLLENKTISIENGELIVGEKGRGPKAVPTYPELCCHSLEDLDVLDSRKVTPYRVSEETKQIYKEEIIPFWKGRDLRSKIFDAMLKEWKKAFKAGVFTEFMEQRAPGHAIMDDKIYRMGLTDFKSLIKEHRKRIDFLNDPDAYSKDQELQAMEVCCDSVIGFASRHTQLARAMARKEREPKTKRELEKIVEVCSRVPAFAPRTFWEALQMYWFIHLGVTLEVNTWDSLNPGRLDLNLYHFYKRDIEDGRLTRDEARELLKCFWIKFSNQPAPPKVDVTMEQSATYQDFATLNLGGVDKHGNDAVNELSYLILEVEDELRMMQPNTCIQISSRNPDHFLEKALKIIRTGHPKPSIFNTDIIIQEQLRQGKTIEEARLGGPSGCVTISAFGKETTVLTGYLNWVKILEVALSYGKDPQTKERIGIKTENLAGFQSFDEVIEAYKSQLKHFINIKIAGNNIIERLFAEHMPVPFQSVLIDDCIETGKDYNNGGAKYNTSYIQGTGLGSLTDCLTSIKYHAFDQKDITLKELLKACRGNFKGKYEIIRQILLNKTPKYGNDNDYADNIAKELVDIYFEALDGKPNTRGGKYRINLLPTTVHIYFGKLCGATPDGRKAEQPISEGVSPTQGVDREGPTAVMKSVTKWDHAKTGGTLLNMKFAPQVLKTEEDIRKIIQLIRTFFRLGGHHVQFNIVDKEKLRDAQTNPEKYRNLLVRVAGYSDYFVDLHKELQDEIISRTEHKP
ncbi:MAG: glycyl radical protein [Candidatus Bathyarchaeota archaeon]|nr:MAG: glycyl radical protein [Candidatus Bathyarchaeota archaeon]